MDFDAARQAMVDCQLATNNVLSERVLQAMGTIPREVFLPEGKRASAYLDEDILIGEGRYMMEPMVIGRMIQALEPRPTDIALDVGGGSGYSAAVLSTMVETVIALEPHDMLRQYAVKMWSDLDLCNIADIDGDSIETAVRNGPYDIIFVNGAVHEVPKLLTMQLREETGRMVCVLRENPKGSGKVVLVERAPGHDDPCVFPLFDANVPYLYEFAPKEHFSF